MTCDQYLDMLGTASVDELLTTHVQTHPAQCAECRRVTLAVLTREQNMAASYAALQPGYVSHEDAIQLIARARRRIVARLYWLGTALAMALTLFYVSYFRGDNGASVPTRTETFFLRCLTAEQAGALLRPYMGVTGSIQMSPGVDTKLVTVRAPAAALAKVHILLGNYDIADGPACIGLPRSDGSVTMPARSF